jgi:hypothetical protein
VPVPLLYALLMYATSSDMLPTADNELDINIEMAWVTL